MLRPLDLRPRRRFSTLTNSSNWCYISSKMFIPNSMSQRMCWCMLLDEFWRFSQSTEHWYNFTIREPRHCCLRSYCAARRHPRFDLYLSAMAFDHCSEEYVRDLAHLYHLMLIETPRPGVQRLLIAYTVDLISVLKELFYFTLRPASALAPTWDDLKNAFETYERSSSRQRIHNIICSKSPQGGQILTADDIYEQIDVLVKG